LVAITKYEVGERGICPFGSEESVDFFPDMMKICFVIYSMDMRVIWEGGGNRVTRGDVGRRLECLPAYISFV
jgi:hypothetical protein